MADILVAGSADHALVGKWNSHFKAAQSARQSFERQWHQNLAFYHGRQWIVVGKSPDGNGFVLSEAPVTDKFRVRLTVNRIKRIIRQELTKLSKEEPQFQTYPASADESDRAAAIAADSIAEYLMYTKHFNLKRTEAALWAVICGTAFMKDWYDPALTDLDGEKGKVDFEAITPFHLFVPYLQVSDIQKQPWVIHARVMSPEDVFNSWGVECRPTTDVAQTLLDSRFLSSIGVQSSKSKAAQMCHVKEVWVKPSKEFPNGAMFVLTEDKVIYVNEAPPVETTEPLSIEWPADGKVPVTDTETEEVVDEGENEGPPQPNIRSKSVEEGLVGYQHEFAYSHMQFPFSKIDHIPTGMFYADSSIKDLIPVQKEYNRTRSVMLENRNSTAKPQYFYTKGSFNPQHFNNKPNLLLAINLGFEGPKPIEQPPLPPSVGNELATASAEMDYLGGSNEIAQGKTPPGVEAASAIAYLQEENDSILFHTVQSLENAIQDTGKRALTLIHDYWTEERIVAAVSKSQAYEVRKFKNARLNAQNDFRVVAGSMAPRSAAAKQAAIVEYIKMGWITPEQGFQYLNMNEDKALHKEMTIDVSQANRENMKMADGEPINIKFVEQGVDPATNMPIKMPKMNIEVDEMGQPVLNEEGQPVQYIVTVNSYDNHQRHVEIHQRYMKTQEFELLSDDVKQVFEDHVDEHKKELIKEMMYAQQGATMGAPVGNEQPAADAEQPPIEEGMVV